MTWMYKLIDYYPAAMVDTLTEVIGYTFQIIGIVLATLFIYKKRPRLTKNKFLSFIIIPSVTLSLDFILISVAASISGEIPVLIAGYGMNLFHGFVASIYLVYLAKYVNAKLSGICFGIGYAFGSLFTWLISLIKVNENSFLASKYVIIAYFALYAISTFINIILAKRLLDNNYDETVSQKTATVSSFASKSIFLTCFMFALVVILLSAIKNVTFYFPTADLTSGKVSIEYTRIFYAIGLIIAGIINDYNRKLGGILCISALFIPFIMLFLQNSSDISAILWIIGYILFGLFAVYRVTVFTDFAKDNSMCFIAPLGLCFGRVGDVLGAILGIKTSGNNTALLIITSILFILVIFLFYASYERLRKLNTTDNPNSEFIHMLISKYGLSQRECDVAVLVFENKTNSEIAKEMFISENTVKFHMKNILKKTGCNNRIDLISSLNQH